MDLKAIDIKSLCRTCLQASENLSLLFNTLLDDESCQKSLLSDILKSAVPDLILSPQDQICSECQKNAIALYRFQKMCLDNEKKIRKALLDSQIKTESAGEVSQDALHLMGKIETSLENSLQSDSNDVTLTELKPLDDEFESDSPDESGEDSEDSMPSSEDDDSKEKKYNCDSCSKGFNSSGRLERHIKFTHQRDKSKSAGSEDDSSDDNDDEATKIFSCDLCPKKFNKPSLLARHLKIHDSSKRPHECPKCQKRFPSQISLVRHDIIHSELVERSRINRPEPQEFICVICGHNNFSSPELLSSHLKTHRNKSEETQEYACKLCNDAQTFPSFTDITRHSKCHIENSTHQCVICQRLFVIGDELIDHFLRHKGMKPHQCPVCEKSFLKLHKLNVHMRIHSDDKLNSYLCPECGKSLSTNENLKRHLIRHTGIKPYACSLCPSRFVFKSGLTSHMSTHTGLKPFICDICGSSFTKSSSLTKHHRIHTGERPYVCEVCGMRFNSSDHVKRHMRTHTGERPYKCQFCERSYAQSNDLLKHTRIHVGENTYKCNLCSAAFRLQAQLREHYRIHYDANNVQIRNTETPEQKPSASEMHEMMFGQQSNELQEQFVKNESDLIDTEKMLYHDLSAKKQKLE